MDLCESADSAQPFESWYDDVKYALLEGLISKYAAEPGTIIDVGCGRGGILARLRAGDNVSTLVGYDPMMSSEVSSALEQKSIDVRSDFPTTLLHAASTVLLMDVLEHVADPSELLSTSSELLRSSGTLIVTVPAYRWLWSSHDEALGHFDRYTARRLATLAATSLRGFELLHIGYAYPLLLAGATPPRLIERLRRRSSRATEPSSSQVDSVESSGLERLLRLVGQSEARALSANSPFGLTCAAVLRAPTLR